MPKKAIQGSKVTISASYRNAPEAIEWICRVFGFKKHAIYPGPNNTIMHSELTLGNGMIMLGSVGDGDYNKRFSKQPDEIGGAETRHINLVVDDADAVYARVKAAGGKIELDIEDKPYGGRGFTCRDLEGHIWNIGSYNPWEPKTDQ